MGNSPALARAPALHDSHSWAFSVELSLAAFFSFGSGDLRRGSTPHSVPVTDPGYSDACSHCHYSHRDGDLAYDWLQRFPPDMDLSCARRDLVTVGDLVAQF